MASLEKLIDERISRLESVPEALQTAIDKQSIELFKAIKSELNSLEIVDGKIVASSANFNRIGSIIEKLKQAVFNKDYVDAITAFAKEIGAQAGLNDQILEKIVGSFSSDALYGETIKAAQKNALMMLDDGAIQQELLQPIADFLSNSITSGADFLDTVDQLKAKLVGENSLLSKYAGRYVKDVFAVSDRQYVKLTSERHGIEFYKWSGGTVKDTRVMCNERHGHIYHKDEIADWGNGNKRDASLERPKLLYTTPAGVKVYWEGMNYDTNGATIFSLAGGYNCNHILLPVATEYVPKADLNRAIALGYYKAD